VIDIFGHALILGFPTAEKTSGGSHTGDYMPKVHITTDNLTLDVKDGYALIDMCEEHDTSILFGCRDGACGACMVKIVKGAENISPIQDDEKDFLETMAAEPNERLACQCKVYGDVTLEVSE
jgi:ferredoxin